MSWDKRVPWLLRKFSAWHAGNGFYVGISQSSGRKHLSVAVCTWLNLLQEKCAH